MKKLELTLILFVRPNGKQVNRVYLCNKEAALRALLVQEPHAKIVRVDGNWSPVHAKFQDKTTGQAERKTERA